MAKKESSFDQIKYQNEYNKKNYDRINLTLPSGMKARIEKCAREEGLAVNTYIRLLIEKDIDE